MLKEYLSLLRCPVTARPLLLKSARYKNGRVIDGSLIEPESGNAYPIVNYIPRFTPNVDYTLNFGFQWNKYRMTQHDQYSRTNISQTRFREETKWPNVLRGEYVLEVGCGSGRFTAHAADTGATIVSFDNSSAVEANYMMNENRSNVLIIQADIYRLPLPTNFFDKIFCFGVLQHTPNPREAFFSIVEFLKPGGKIASDIYIKNFTNWLLGTKYYVRHITKNMNSEILYKNIQRYVDFIWPLANMIMHIPKFGPAINWRLLIPDYSRLLTLGNRDLLKEWAYLDAFDMLSPAYDYPQTLKTFKKWHVEKGLVDIEIQHGYNGLEGRATKPL
jgi:SAM-dependent methyltransferase